MNSYEESGDTLNKDPENENSPLTSLEIIELSSDSKKRKNQKSKSKDLTDSGYIFILIIFIISAFLFSSKPFSSKEINKDKSILYKYQNERNNSNIEENFGNSSLNNSKMNIAFYYPTLTKFMISTAELLIKRICTL